MRLKIEPPHPMETKGLQVDAQTGCVTVDPRVLPRNPLVRLGYLTAEGAGGASAKAVLSFNTRTAEFVLYHLDAAGSGTCPFDLPPSELLSQRAAARERQVRRSAVPADPLAAVAANVGAPPSAARPEPAD